MKLNLIESRIDLEIDSELMDALTLVSKWKKATNNKEIQQMSSIIVKLTAYISKLRLERAAAIIEVGEQRVQKNKAIKSLDKLWEQ